MTTLPRRLGYFFFAALVLASAAGTRAAPAEAPTGTAPRLVVFEDFTRFT